MEQYLLYNLVRFINLWYAEDIWCKTILTSKIWNMKLNVKAENEALWNVWMV